MGTRIKGVGPLSATERKLMDHLKGRRDAGQPITAKQAAALAQLAKRWGIYGDQPPAALARLLRLPS